MHFIEHLQLELVGQVLEQFVKVFFFLVVVVRDNVLQVFVELGRKLVMLSKTVE